MKKTILVLLMIAGLCFNAKAQHFAVSTNILDWAEIGTMNLGAEASIARHLTLDAGVRYNPFEIQRQSGLMVANQKTSAHLGLRYWPWYVYSGWWVEAKARWSDYYNTGIWRIAVDEGKALGGGLSAGYTWMLTKHVNLDFGAGFWGGKLLEHNLYHCLNCMEIRQSGPRGFFGIDDVSVSIMFLF